MSIFQVQNLLHSYFNLDNIHIQINQSRRVFWLKIGLANIMILEFVYPSVKLYTTYSRVQ